MPNRYIIDTNVLIQYPQILSRAGNRKILIPASVIEELSLRGPNNRTKGLSNLIGSAISAGVKIVQAPTSSDYTIFQTDKNAQRLSGVDIDIALIAITYAKERGVDTPCVVTADKALASFLSTHKIKTITGFQFIVESKNEPMNEEIIKSANRVVTFQKRYLYISFILGVLASIAGNYIYSNIEYLVSTITIWGTMAGLPIIGVALFWCREKFRLSYGTFEFCVGVIMSYYVFFPSFVYAEIGIKQGFQILAGLYVIVRGLDNIGKGILGTRIESMWRKIF